MGLRLRRWNPRYFPFSFSFREVRQKEFALSLTVDMGAEIGRQT